MNTELIVQQNKAKVDDKIFHSDQAVVDDHDRQGATGQAGWGNVAAVVH